MISGTSEQRKRQGAERRAEGKPRKTAGTVQRGHVPQAKGPGEETRGRAEIKPPSMRRVRAMTNGNGSPTQQQGSSVLWHAAREFAKAAEEYQTRGNMETRSEAWEMPDTLQLIADGIRARAEANAREDLDPALQALYARIADSVQAAAHAARELGPGFDAFHQQLVENLLSGVRPEKWDSANNRLV